MSITKVNLQIRTMIDLELLEKGIILRLVRLIGILRFKINSGWSNGYDAIIDTGGPISIIPYSIWEKANINLLSSEIITLQGISSSKDVGIKGRIGEIKCALVDERHTSPVLTIKAYLLLNDDHPLIIGFEDILTQARLVSDYKNKESYLEF